MPIEYYQIKPAGMQESGEGEKEVAGEGVGFGKIVSIHNESLVGQVYFEVHPDQLEGAGKISVEFYGNVGFGLSDCAEHGQLLSEVVVGTEEPSTSANDFNSTSWGVVQSKETSPPWFTSIAFAFPEYNAVYRDLHVECHPRSTGAVMAGVEYSISNPFERKSSIWFPDSVHSTKGRLDYCIRVKVNPQPTEPTVEVDEPESLSSYKTYLDTKIRIEGDQSQPDFSTSNGKASEVSSTHSSQAIEAVDETVQDSIKIDVVAVPCSDGGRGKYNDYGTILSSSLGTNGVPKRNYAVGQVFRVCVSPTAEFVEDYSVAAFESVVCENFGEGRSIVQNFASTDNSIEPEWLASSSAASGSESMVNYFNMENGNVLLGRNTISFRTRVTPGFRSLNETSLVCSGIVRVRPRSFSRTSKTGSKYENLTDSEFDRLEWAQEQTTVRSDFSTRIDLFVIRPNQEKEEGSRPKKLVAAVVILVLLWLVGLVFLCRYYRRHFLNAFPQCKEPFRRFSNQVKDWIAQCKEWTIVDRMLSLFGHQDSYDGDDLDNSGSHHRLRHDRRHGRASSDRYDDKSRRKHGDRHNHHYCDRHQDGDKPKHKVLTRKGKQKYKPSQQKHNPSRSFKKRDTQRIYIDFSGSLSDASSQSSGALYDCSESDTAAGYIPAASEASVSEDLSHEDSTTTSMTLP